MEDCPQVILFGSIYGEWREKHIIPVLDELQVTYYNPVASTGWTKEHGDREVEVMANCETIVMVVNSHYPSFTSLAETGWAALGAAVRGQHFILQVDPECKFDLPDYLRQTPDGEKVQAWIDHWIRSSRYLVTNHAKQFNVERLHVVETLEDVATNLRRIYSR